jgi:hypothetical protein
MRGFTQNRQIGIALPLAVMNRIRRQIGGYRMSSLEQRQLQNVNGRAVAPRALPIRRCSQ